MPGRMWRLTGEGGWGDTVMSVCSSECGTVSPASGRAVAGEGEFTSGARTDRSGEAGVCTSTVGAMFVVLHEDEESLDWRSASDVVSRAAVEVLPPLPVAGFVMVASANRFSRSAEVAGKFRFWWSPCMMASLSKKLEADRDHDNTPGLSDQRCRYMARRYNARVHIYSCCMNAFQVVGERVNLDSAEYSTNFHLIQNKHRV